MRGGGGKHFQKICMIKAVLQYKGMCNLSLVWNELNAFLWKKKKSLELQKKKSSSLGCHAGTLRTIQPGWTVNVRVTGAKKTLSPRGSPHHHFHSLCPHPKPKAKQLHSWHGRIRIVRAVTGRAWGMSRLWNTSTGLKKGLVFFITVRTVQNGILYNACYCMVCLLPTIKLGERDFMKDRKIIRMLRSYLGPSFAAQWAIAE